jgi:osmotically-inducible protein OsmY
VGLNLVAEGDVADVNYRVAVDSFGTVYLLGRARSKPELNAALKAARETEGARKLINYVVVRP